VQIVHVLSECSDLCIGRRRGRPQQTYGLRMKSWEQWAPGAQVSHVTSNFYDQTDKPPKHGDAWNQKAKSHVGMTNNTQCILKTFCCVVAPSTRVYIQLAVRRTTYRKNEFFFFFIFGEWKHEKAWKCKDVFARTKVRCLVLSYGYISASKRNHYHIWRYQRPMLRRDSRQRDACCNTA